MNLEKKLDYSVKNNTVKKLSKNQKKECNLNNLVNSTNQNQIWFVFNETRNKKCIALYGQMNITGSKEAENVIRLAEKS